MSRRTLSSVLILALSLAGCGRGRSSLASSPKVPDDLLELVEGSHPLATHPVLVALKEQAQLPEIDREESNRIQRGEAVYAALTATAQRSQVDILRWLDSNERLKYRRFYIVNMIAIENAGSSDIEALVQRADVAKVYHNPSVPIVPSFMRVPEEESPTAQGPEPGLQAAGATIAWSHGIRGAGIVIGGQDTGVQWDHPALKGHYRGWNGTDVDHRYSWHDAIHQALGNPCGADRPEPCDDNGHGTHTVGSIVGDDGGTNQIGMAPDAQWVACRNMDQGTGTPASYIECFEWFLAPYPQGEDPMTTGRPDLAPHVLNNSWGCPGYEGCSGAEMVGVLEALQAAGIMVVASAGNDGPDCSTIADQPAHHSALTLSVGAYSTSSGHIADFSSRGPSRFDGVLGPDLVAPGVNIRSAVPGSDYEGGWSGTSMAGPHVVGAVALLWSARPELIGDSATTALALTASAAPKTTDEVCGGVDGSAIPNNTFGYGTLDVARALGFQ